MKLTPLLSACYVAIISFLSVSLALTACQRVPKPQLPPPGATSAYVESLRLRSAFRLEGADLNRRQPITYILEFIDKEGAQRAVADCVKKGFRSSVSKEHESEIWSCTMSKNLVPASHELESSTSYALSLAKRLHGSYWTGEARALSTDYDTPAHERALLTNLGHYGRDVKVSQVVYLFITYLDPGRHVSAEIRAREAGFGVRVDRDAETDGWIVRISKKVVPDSVAFETCVTFAQELAKRSGGGIIFKPI